jgi:cell division protease FtsH
VAEEIVLGEISTGASNDLERVTEIARQMVTQYGMSEKLGPMQYGSRQGQVFLGKDLSSEQNYSDRVAYEIDEEMKKIIESCHERTRQILTERRDRLEALAQRLLEKETVDEDEIRSIMSGGADGADQPAADPTDSTDEDPS